MSGISTRIQRLLPRQLKIVDMAAAGHTIETIAATLEMAPRSVALILKSPLAQSELARLRRASSEHVLGALDREAVMGKARSILEGATEKAALKHVDLLNCGNPSIEMKAAAAILDRAFGNIEDKNKSIVVNVTTEQAALIQIALKESKNERFKPANGASTNGSEAVDAQVELRIEERSPDSISAEGSEGGPIDVYTDPAEER